MTGTEGRRVDLWLAPVDARPLVLFRTLFGLLLACSAGRFVARGWVETLVLAPTLHFPWPGFAWVPMPSAAGFGVLFGLLIATGLGLAAGWAPRRMAAVHLVCFMLVEVLDLTLYLNHYYLVSLLLGLLVVLPGPVNGRVPRVVLGCFKAQIALVYLFAGIAKINHDWLVLGEPLHTWLSARVDLPWAAPVLASPAVAVAMSWAGCLYDLTIPLWLWWRPTRRLAWISVAAFHVSTAMLFPIGVFPWLMMASSTLFWEPPSAGQPPTFAPAPRWLPALVLGWLGVQVLLPLRHVLTPGDVNWHGEGFRFSWRVMLVEKTGFVELRVVDRQTGRARRVSPRSDLTPSQLHQMSFQPDMIVQYAHVVGERAGGAERVQVFADAWVSRNGRRARQWIDPTVDLMGPLPVGWICAEVDCPGVGE